MSASVGVNFTLKVVINKEENKVLFAEVDRNFADVLISFMTLPLGTIVRLLANHFADQAPRIGSLSTLYQGLSNLESRHFCSATDNGITQGIIRKSTNKVLLAQADEDFIDFLFSLLTIPLGRVVCLLGSNTCLGSVDNLYMSITNLDTERYLNTEDLKSALLKPQLPPEYLSKNQIFSHTEAMSNRYYGSNMNFVDLNSKSGYVKGPAMFMVTDDLVVTPSSAISSLSLIKNLKIPFSDVEELQFEIGMEEALNILKSSFTSTSALTDGLKPILKRQLKQEK